MNIEEKIKFYKENLGCFEETMDKYKYLLDQGKKAELFPEEYRQDNFKIQGCQAQVWLIPKYDNIKLNFYSDSDAFITKGMITILVDIYGNNTPSVILSKLNSGGLYKSIFEEKSISLSIFNTEP